MDSKLNFPSQTSTPAALCRTACAPLYLGGSGGGGAMGRTSEVDEEATRNEFQYILHITLSGQRPTLKHSSLSSCRCYSCHHPALCSVFPSSPTQPSPAGSVEFGLPKSSTRGPQLKLSFLCFTQFFSEQKTTRQSLIRSLCFSEL